MRKSLFLSLLISALTISALSGCGINSQKEVATNAEEKESAQDENVADEVDADLEENEVEDTDDVASDITIVYTNDVHSYIDNVVKDNDGNVTGDGLRFSKIKAMVDDMRADGKEVILVDAGDEIQGDIYGAMDEGATVLSIMEKTGYQLATPGNHEFDYGVIEFLKLAESAAFPYVTCNFHQVDGSETIFSDSKVFEIAGKKVAFVGVTTPETITSSTPVYFQDENGEYIYSIDGTKDAKDMYDSVQKAIDEVKQEADYVIGLGHVGVGFDAKRLKISSEDLIGNVSGFDAFIDGHSHTTMEKEVVKDKEGKDVVLTQTGAYLSAVGIMTIAEDGSISTKLVNDYDREDEEVAKLENDWIQDINDQMNVKIGTLDTPLYTNNPDNDKQRLIRAMELNLGDFTADSVYWYFNDKLELDCDIAIQNGGGIRAQIDAGDLTYMSAKKVEPFGNMVCLISASGQQIVDALEMGTNVIGLWNDEWDMPAETGGFLQVAGLSYNIDASVPSSVNIDENGMFESVTGDYRVKDVKVYNRDNGKYEPIELDKNYQVGGINYMLRNSGCGLSMFAEDELVVDYIGQDYIILAEYIKSFSKDGDYARVNTANCPLSHYEGYLLDYENAYGSGRINIQNVKYDK